MKINTKINTKRKKIKRKKDKNIKLTKKKYKLAKGLSRKSNPIRLNSYDSRSPINYSKSRITKKRRYNLKGCLNDNCPITMTNLNLSKRNPFAGKYGTVKLTCNHCFSKIGITKWIKGGEQTCPMCRRPIDKSIIEELVPPEEDYYDDYSNHGQEEDYDPFNMLQQDNTSRSRSHSRSRSRSHSRSHSRSYSEDDDDLGFHMDLLRETYQRGNRRGNQTH